MRPRPTGELTFTALRLRPARSPTISHRSCEVTAARSAPTDPPAGGDVLEQHLLAVVDGAGLHLLERIRLLAHMDDPRGDHTSASKQSSRPARARPPVRTKALRLRVDPVASDDLTVGLMTDKGLNAVVVVDESVRLRGIVECDRVLSETLLAAAP